MSGTWYSVVEYGAIGDGATDDTAAIQAAFDAAAGGGTVEFPEGGVYCVSDFIVCGSLTTVWAHGATIRSVNPSRGVFRNFRSTDSYAGYGGRSDISILGGTWDGNAYKAADGSGVVTATTNIVSFIHCRNITVRDAVFRDCSSAHALELNAVSNATVENCRFEGFADNSGDGSRSTSEAIQVDVAKQGSSSIPAFDETVCKDILIANCLFDASSRLGVFGRAVGSHSVGAQDYERITIQGCTVRGALESGVLAFHWKDSLVSQNKILAVGGYGIKGDRSPSLTITGNHISATDSGGIIASECDRAVVTSNQVRNTGSNGINLAEVTGGLVSGNLVDGTSLWHGITAGGSGTSVVITGNVIFDPASAGVRVTTANSTVTNNKVRGGANGVSVTASGVAVAGNDLRHNGWSTGQALLLSPGTLTSFTGSTSTPGDNLT